LFFKALLTGFVIDWELIPIGNGYSGRLLETAGQLSSQPNWAVVPLTNTPDDSSFNVCRNNV
jgi:hypothetical protein